MRKIGHKFNEIMCKIADLFTLNIMFIFSCIPMITIGAAITSLYYMTGKLLDGEEGNIVKEYWKMFRKSFKTSTQFWLGYLAIFMFAYINSRISRGYVQGYWKLLLISAWLVMIVLMILITYTFPILSRKIENKQEIRIKEVIHLAGIHAIAFLPKTVFMTLCNTIFFVIVLFSSNFLVFIYGGIFYAVIGFALISYINSKMLKEISNTFL